MIRLLAAFVCLWPAVVSAQDAEPPMTLPRMAQIVQALDPDAMVSGAGFSFTVDDIPVLIVTDVRANRMRAIPAFPDLPATALCHNDPAGRDAPDGAQVGACFAAV